MKLQNLLESTSLITHSNIIAFYPNSIEYNNINKLSIAKSVFNKSLNCTKKDLIFINEFLRKAVLQNFKYITSILKNKKIAIKDLYFEEFNFDALSFKDMLISDLEDLDVEEGYKNINVEKLNLITLEELYCMTPFEIDVKLVFKLDSNHAISFEDLEELSNECCNRFGKLFLGEHYSV